MTSAKIMEVNSKLLSNPAFTSHMNITLSALGRSTNADRHWHLSEVLLALRIW